MIGHKYVTVFDVLNKKLILRLFSFLKQFKYSFHRSMLFTCSYVFFQDFLAAVIQFSIRLF